MAPYRDEENNGEYYGGVDGRMRPEGEYVPGTKKRKRFREMVKADILEDNRMNGSSVGDKIKSEMSGDETKGNEGENKNGIREEKEMGKEGEQPETIKKKRRRQKKKKKDGVASVDDSNNGRSLSNSSKAKNDTATVHSDDVIKKQENKVVQKENTKDVIRNEKDTTKKDEESGIKKKESGEENSGGEIKKKKRKTRKKKGTKVEGVSKSRLASYGL